MTTTTGIKLEEAVRQRLKELGDARGRSAHWLMRVAIEEYLEREERYEREKHEDQARWERYQLSGQAVSHERASVWLKDLASGKETPWPK